MAAPIRFLSGRNQQQKIGIEGSTENQKVLEVVGRVGIGTTIFEPTSELEVRGDIKISGILTAGNIDVSTGQVNFSQLNVTGVSTFGNTIDANGRIVGAATSNVIPFLYSNFTDLPSAATYHGAFAHVHSTGKAYYAHAGNWVELVNKEVNGTVGTGTERYNIGPVDLTTLDVSGISTFTGAADFNGSIDVDGHTELDDVNVSGAITATTFTGNLAGTVNTAAQPNITSVGTLSALTVSGDITANGNIAGDNSTNITGIAGVTATTLSGTLQTAAQPNITSVGTLSALTVSGDITANGNIAGDNSTNITGIAGVTATTLSGTLQTAAQTNITSVGTLTGLDINGHSELDDVNVSGAITATTFTGNLAGTVNTAAQTNITSLGTLSALTVSGDITANGNIAGDGATNITGIAGVTATTLSGTLQTAAQTNITSVGTLTGLDVNGHSELDNVNVSGIITTASLNATGKLTTTGIGISIANGAGNTAYIEGPAEIWIDPHPFGVGQTSGSVRIRGDLYVDGTEFIVDVDKIELGDFNIGIASTVSTNSLLDGAGLGIGATNIRKFITWNNATSALMSSENWNLASGKHYEINGTDVLTSDTLGSGVINSSLTSVGTLGALTVSGNVNANGNIIGDNSTNITGIAGVTASTLTGTLQTAAQTNVTSVGTLGALTVSGNVNANGNIIGDNATNISGINSVTATSFYGSGTNLTGINAGQIADVGLTIREEGSLVGTASSVKNINFVGSNLTATASGVGATITLTDTPTFSSLNVTGTTTIPNISGVTTFANTVNVGTGITLDPTSGIISATAFFGDGQNLSNLINQRIEGLQIFDEGVAVGTGFTFAALDVVGSNISISAVGLGTTAVITLSDTPTFDTVAVTNNITANGNIVGDNSTNISGINSVTATSFYGSGANLTSIPNSALTNDSVSFGGVSLDLGQTDATPAFNLSDATNYPTSSLSGTITNAQLAGSIADGKLASTFLKNVVEDTTPQLGGNLDLNSKFISGTGGINVSGVVTATSFVGDGSNLTNLPASTNITVADESTDTTCFPVFTTAATGNQAPKTGTNLTFNSSNGTLTATTFSGALSGNATSATTATNVTVTANNSANETVYPVFVDGATGSQGAETDTGLSYNPSTGLFTAVAFSGSGASLTAVDAATLDGVDSTSFLRSDTADVKTSGNLRFNNSVEATFGTSDDLRIYHASGFSYIIQEGGNDLVIEQTTDDEDVVIKSDNGSGSTTNYFLADGSTGEAVLYHYGSQKLATKSGGIDVSGTVTATTFSGSGASLTSIPNSALTNDSVSFGGVSVDLGASDATPAFNLSDATAYPTSSLTGTITNAQLAGSIADGKLASTFLKNVVEDTTPQLGGNLDFNGKYITGTGGLNVTGVVTATTFVGNLTGTASAASGLSTTISINTSGIITATSFAGDGSELTGISGGGGSGEFNTGITSSRQIVPLSFESTVFTFPSTAGRQYTIESINVANVDASVGVGTTVNIIASIQDATAAEQTYIAYNVPIVTGGLIELLKNPIVAGPSDVIRMWSTNDGYAGVSNATEVYMSYSEFESTDYISKFASTTTINSTDAIALYTSTSNPTVIEKIGFANRTDIGDFPISIKITNGTTTSYLAKDLIIPRYSTVDILDRPKRIETGAKIEVEVGSTSTVDVIISGKKITS